MSILIPEAPIVSLCGSPEETEALGTQLAAKLQGGSVIALHGDLGAGKTVIARGIARGLGIQSAVTSPTFTVVQEYLGNVWTLYHIDLYRLSSEDDAIAFGIEDFLADRSAITILEWAERLPTLLPAETVHITLERVRETERRITQQQGRPASSKSSEQQ